jgi:branched-chain amino acid transport system substrate-binding protein
MSEKYRFSLFFVIFICLLMTCFLFPGMLQAQIKKEIVIGAPIPLSGILSMEGDEERWAFEQAVKDVNAKGGIFVKQYKQKLPVKLIIADTESDPARSAAVVEMLVRVHKVDLLLSTFSTNLVLPTSDAAEKLKIYYHTTTCILEPWRAGKFQWSTLYFFETLQAGELPFQLLDSIPATERPNKVAILMEDSTDGRAFGPAFRAGAKKYKYNIAVNEPLAVGAKDYSSQILKLKSKGIDGIIIFASSGDCITFLRQTKETGLNWKYIYGIKGAWAPDFWKALGKDAQYVLADGFWHMDFPYPHASELGQQYEKSYKKHSVSIGLFYALAQTLFAAIDTAGTLDGAKIRDVVLHTSFKETVMGNVQYGPDGTAIFPCAAFQWWDGKLKVAYPFLKGGWKVKVAPPWNKR